MVRQWSYINNLPIIGNKNLFLNSKHSLKIFRQTTRFKKYNLYATFFIRKSVILQQRRTSLKFYVLLSSIWTKTFLRYKKVVNFIQLLSIYNFSLTCSYNRMFDVSISSLSVLLSNDSVSLNYVFMKNSLSKTFFYKNPTLLKPLIYFKSINSIKKINNLGLGFTQIKTPSEYILFNNFNEINRLIQTNNQYELINLSFLLITLNRSVSFKSIHTNLILYFITKNQI